MSAALEKWISALLLMVAFPLPAVAAGHHSAEWLYVLHCSGCHGKTGAGAPAAGIPDFNNSIGNIVRHQDGKRYVVNVAGVRNAGLDDADVARVLNYILSRWGKKPDGHGSITFQPAEIASLKLHDMDIVATRKAIEKYLDGNGLAYSRYPW